MQDYEHEAKVELRVCAALADEAAQLFVAEAKREAAFYVALSGGTTPGAMFDRLASRYADDVDWGRVHFFWGDERTVGPDHPDSNFGQAKRRLLDPLKVPAENVHRFEGERPADDAAARYADELRRVFDLRAGELPRFNLLYLGLGDDGHTASLFPETSALAQTHTLATANAVPKLNTTRLTLTYPVINNAACIAVLVAGKSKAEMLQRVLKSPAIPTKYPVQGVRPRAGRLLWLADRDAAGSSAV